MPFSRTARPLLCDDIERKARPMRVALTVWQERISPLFDATRRLLVATIKGHKIIDSHYEAFDCALPLSRISRLLDLGVDVLICGGISDDFFNLIEAQGIEIIPFTSGIVDEVLGAYLSNTLCNDPS